MLVEHMSEEMTVLAGAGSFGSRGSIPTQAPGPALTRLGPFPQCCRRVAEKQAFSLEMPREEQHEAEAGRGGWRAGRG